MDLETILNDCLNKAMCQCDRIKQPDSNTIAEWVSNYLREGINIKPSTEREVCSKCGGVKICGWCEPFNQPILPEGIVF